MSSTHVRRKHRGFRYSEHLANEFIDTEQMDCAWCGLALPRRGEQTRSVFAGPFVFGAHIRCVKKNGRWPAGAP